jgi:uncharacterized protein (TIGR03083 family)
VQSASTTHIAALELAGGRLAHAASLVSPDTPVPTCPDWAVRDLVHHIGGVHRWAASIVSTGRSNPYTSEEEVAFFAAPSDGELVEWFSSGHEALVRTFREAGPALECWAFLPAPSPLAFWARRQAHETMIHCFDAENAAGVPVPALGHVSAEIAADGIDELLCGFLARSGGRLLTEPPTTLRVQAKDTELALTIRIEADRRVVTPTAKDADCVVSGRAADLYLFLWNRVGRESLTIEGDPEVLDLWREKALVSWG